MKNRRTFASRFALWGMIVPLTLAGCAGSISATATARTAATVVSIRPTQPPQTAPKLDIQGIPQRSPDRNIGAHTDGWVLDRIESSRNGTFTTLSISFVPPNSGASIPQTDGWYEGSSGTYVLEIQGIRGSNLVLRPNDLQPLSLPPLTGYYSLRVMDDGIFALAITSEGAQKANWSLSAGTSPGVVRFSVDFK